MDYERVKQLWAAYYRTPFGITFNQNHKKVEAWKRYCEARDRRPIFYYDSHGYDGYVLLDHPFFNY